MPESYYDRMRNGTLAQLGARRYDDGGLADDDSPLGPLRTKLNEGLDWLYDKAGNLVLGKPADLSRPAYTTPSVAAPGYQPPWGGPLNIGPSTPPVHHPAAAQTDAALQRAAEISNQLGLVVGGLGSGGPENITPRGIATNAGLGALQTLAPPRHDDLQEGIIIAGRPEGETVVNAAGKTVGGGLGGAKGTIYTPLQSDIEALAQKLKPDNPEAGMRPAAAALKWQNWEKPEAEATYGPLMRTPATESKLLRMRNTPARVQERIQQAQDFLAQPTDPWMPKDYGIFDRSLIQQSLGGFPDVQQTPFPRSQATRADMSYIDEIYRDRVNRDLIKQQIARGLPLGGETFYPSLYPVKAEAIARGLTSETFPQTGGDLFENWIHSVAPGSARNSIYNERAVGNFLRNMTARGIPLTPENVTKEMAAFRDRWGTGLPLMPVHAQGAAKVLEQGISPIDVLQQNLTDSYKIPTYAAQQTGNFAHSWTGDVHEATGETLGSRYHPYFNAQGGFGVNEYGPAEQHMRDIAQEMGVPTGSAQAGRWFGGGELTGLKSPRGDSLDLLERQAAYTLHGLGQPTDPASVRNYVMKLIQEGGDLRPWFRNDPMPDYRQMAEGRSR